MINKNKILELTKANIKKKLETTDQKIINMSLIIQKLPSNINELYEELSIITDQEYPSLDKYLTIKEYCEFYSSGTNKESKDIKKILDSDIGIKLSKSLKKITTDLSKNILDLIKTKENLEEEIDHLTKKNYINLYTLATPKIAYKMLEIAGSFERLARFPASTVQLLGSEKSFFKALKQNKKTPKYGVIYNHPLLVNLSNKNKAKMARSLAAKISLGVKVDLEGKDISKFLEDKIKLKISELK